MDRATTRLAAAMSRVLKLATVACAGLGVAGLVIASTVAAPAAGRASIRVTVVGDSVAGSISYVSTAQTLLERRLSLRLDLEVCRRLVQPSCPYQGRVPTTALQAVRSYRRSLGRVLVVDVGYNESSRGYGAGIDRIMLSALSEGASGVVWVTLRETSAVYHATNREIRAAARRWPQLVVADWNAHSAGRPWFGSDGLHLNPAGATALASFLRPYVFRAAILGA